MQDKIFQDKHFLLIIDSTERLVFSTDNSKLL